MSVISYKELKKYLKSIEKDGGEEQFPPVCLIYGEELLYKTAFDNFLNALIPVSTRSFNYEPIGGENEKIPEAVQLVNTYPLLPGARVVAICDSQIFYLKQDEKKLLEKAKQGFDDNDLKKASKYLLSLLGRLNLSVDDVGSVDDAGKTEKNRILKLDSDSAGEVKWLDKVIDYCRDNGLGAVAAKDNSKVLQEAIEKGFPKGNHLIITTDLVDKRRSLFKAVDKHGMIVDCSVPQGSRMADKKAQEAVLNETMAIILAQSKKTIAKRAYPALYEMTGFDLRTFSNNLKKLINYVGDRDEITVDDVETVLKRTKKDPIYDFTNAITDKNIAEALFYMDSLLSGNEIGHPLQLLAAMVNQMRKLLLIKGFVESTNGHVWHAGMQYNDFTAKVMPAIQNYDSAFLKLLKDKEDMIVKKPENKKLGDKKPGDKKKGKKKKGKPVATDLLIAKNAKNPYPVYQLFKKSERFKKDELFSVFECLSKADLRLKTTGQNPKLILEEAVFQICGTQVSI